MKGRNKRAVYRGGPSEILEPLYLHGYKIQVLKHGNTGHTLYRAPRVEDLEPQWTMDLETAKKGVIKWKEAGCPSPEAAGLSGVESVTA